MNIHDLMDNLHEDSAFLLEFEDKKNISFDPGKGVGKSELFTQPDELYDMSKGNCIPPGVK